MARSLHKRNYWGGLASGLRWLFDPVNGGGHVVRMGLSMRGPELLAQRERMEQHPTGRRLLEERPDLAAALTDVEALQTLPEGSLGRSFYELTQDPQTIAGYTISGQVYRGGFFDSIEMDDATRWMVDRQLLAHDLSHLVSGYGTDQSGETLVVMFTEAWTQGMPRSGVFTNPYGMGASILRSKVGSRAWKQHILDAYDRGATAAERVPFCCIAFEELLDQPLGEVREQLGVPPLPDDWDTSDWLEGSWMARRADATLDVRGAKELQAMVEAGVPWRDLMRAPKKTVAELRRQVRDGATAEAMLDVLHGRA